MSDIALFHFDEDRANFEDVGLPNGVRYWLEADLMKALDYQTSEGFRKAVTRAMQACLSLNIAIEENFVHVDGQYKFTRFGCYLIAMNGDSKKPQVAQAQVYFAVLAETFLRHQDHAEGIERVLDRDEMSDGLKALSSTAKRHGVKNYAFFQNAGYRGMYNMNLAKLMAFKGLSPDDVLLDRMGRVESAAHRFRVTQTEERIRKQKLQGQEQLETAAFEVGRIVRKTMQDINGTTPEHLPVAPPINQIKKKLKETNKKLKSLDSPKKKPPKPKSDK